MKLNNKKQHKTKPIFKAVFDFFIVSGFNFRIEMTSESNSITPPSTEAVSEKIQDGMQTLVVQTGVGLIVGGMAGIVLSRGGSSSARKVLAGFGAGIGAGSAWTKCSMSIDDLLSSK